MAAMESPMPSASTPEYMPSFEATVKISCTMLGYAIQNVR